MSTITLNIYAKELKKSRPHIKEAIANVSEVQGAKRGLMRKMLLYRLEDDIRVLNSLPGVSCIAGTDGYLIWVSDSFCELTGWSIDELTANDIWFFIHPEDHAKTQRAYDAQKDGSEIDVFNNRWLSKYGEYITLNWRASEVQSDGFIRANAVT